MHKYDTFKVYNLPLISFQTNTNITIKFMTVNIFPKYSSRSYVLFNPSSRTTITQFCFSVCKKHYFCG